MTDYRSDIVEQLRDASTAEKESYEYMILAGFAAAEVERLRERIKELEPYEVVSGEQWKARNTYEEIELLKAKLAEYEGAPVRIRHIMKTGKMPEPDDPR